MPSSPHQLASLQADSQQTTATENTAIKTSSDYLEHSGFSLASTRKILPVLAFLTTSCAVATGSTNWEKTIWQGEPAWASSQGQVRAVVTEARTRLIYLGAIDGSFNLLNAPWPQVLPDKNNSGPNQGGHRFWLGPQNRWVWPPPADWEYSASQYASTQAGVLTLHHAHVDSAYPAITREYAWDGSRLRCTARWQDDSRGYFGIHVVAVNTPLAVTARLKKTNIVPNGLVVAQMVNPEAPIHLPRPSITIENDNASVRSGIETIKLGFTLQPLTVDRPDGWKLSVLPGPATVPTSESPDHGYLSQIWVGDKTNDLAELEQLTPYLKGDAAGRCSSTIYLEATPPNP